MTRREALTAAAAVAGAVSLRAAAGQTSAPAVTKGRLKQSVSRCYATYESLIPDR